MEYTVQRLARLAGVSARTLRYYDEIGLLRPARVNAAGYRLYGSAQVDRLQQILFYRELGVGLERIGAILDAPGFDAAGALAEHRERLLAERARLDALIANVERTIAMKEGRLIMKDKDKFAGFKERLVADNEKKYGAEVRAKCGDAAVDRANAKVAGMTEADYAEVTALAEELTAALRAALATGDPAGEAAQRAADLHRRWLSFYWDGYSPEAHAGLARMYVEDERFKAYYDQVAPGVAELLRDAILVYTGCGK